MNRRGFVVLSLCLAVLGSAAHADADALAPFASLKGTIDIAGGTAHVPVMKEAAQLVEEPRTARSATLRA